VSAATWRPTPREREDVIEAGLSMGLTIADLAGYLGVSCTTARRDRKRHLAWCAERRTLEPWQRGADAYRATP
jgi:hypothetical protein